MRVMGVFEFLRVRFLFKHCILINVIVNFFRPIQLIGKIKQCRGIRGERSFYKEETKHK